MISDLRKRKSNYEPGVWNPDSIFLGGLGNDPELEKDADPLMKLKKTLEESKPKVKKIQFFKSEIEDNKEE